MARYSTRASIIAGAIVCTLAWATGRASASIAFVSGKITASVYTSHPAGGIWTDEATPAIYTTEMGLHSVHSHAQTPNGTAVADVLMKSTRSTDLLSVQGEALFYRSSTLGTAYGRGDVFEVLDLSEPATLQITIAYQQNTNMTLYFRHLGEPNAFYAAFADTTHAFDAGQFEVQAVFYGEASTFGTSVGTASITYAPEPASALLGFGIVGLITRRQHRRTLTPARAH